MVPSCAGGVVHTPQRLLMVGCGILHKEIRWLVRKNGWPLDTVMLGSALHNDFHKLSKGLTATLERYREREPIVFYGCCHPRMDQILESARTFRTTGQNCVEMLLGRELFMQELEQGAYFLLEDWAIHWRHVTRGAFGDNLKVMREVFQLDRQYILALKTPCSDDFTALAETAAGEVDLPLRWMEVGLEHLEAVLREAVERKLAEAS